MFKQKVARTSAAPDNGGLMSLLKQYGCGPVQFTGAENALYERHLLFDHVVAVGAANAREGYEAFARSVRDVLSQRWIHTEDSYDGENAKRVYYLSMEFLIGRALANKVTKPCPFMVPWTKKPSVQHGGSAIERSQSSKRDSPT